MRITASARIQNNTWRFDPDTGFLRCTASILRAGIMMYTRADLDGADIPAQLGDQIRLYVPQNELEDPESVASLEGKPIVIGHTWQTAGALTDCGNHCGAPMVQGDHLISDILITDAEAVRRIMLPESDPNRLQEISSAGDWLVVFDPGTAPDGQAYDGYFVKLRYNHSALLPPGAGRAGASVRIINEREAPKMEFTRVQIRNKKTGTVRTVRVANEDVAELEKAMVENEEIIESAVTPEQLQAALEELTALKSETEEKNKRIAELEGMIQTYKDQLDAALSPAVVEEAAAEMAEERDEAVTVMNAAGVTGVDVKGLRGHGLRAKVLNSIRVKNGKPELTAEEIKDESLVKGMYRATIDIGGHARKVPGAEVVTQAHIQNQQTAPVLTNSSDRMNRLYGKKEGN
jgi:hypothetical protein